MRTVRVLVALFLASAFVACQQAAPASDQKAAAPAGGAPAGSTALTPAPHGSLAEVMRGIPFPNSNIIFDTQTNDPGAAKKPVENKGSQAAAGGATGVYSSVYGGWQAVENAAVALQETANLIMVPGRKWENGLPVPLDQENFKKAIDGLVKAGETAYKAAKSKNMDQMVDASGVVSDACLACHEKYRDVPQGKMRCVPVP